MWYIRFIIFSILFIETVSGAAARTYYLPDYQNEFIYGSRVQDSDSGQHTSTPSCSTYGYYSAPQNNADCARVKDPVPGLSCYSCTSCSSDYAYDSSNCSGDYMTSGSSCGGKYSKCICSPAKYPSASGCPAGQKIDTASSCKGPSDTGTVYKCIDDSCYGVTQKNTCETQGKYCVPSTECASGCEQCVERCSAYKTYEGAIECDNGCEKASDEISGCSGLCKAGSTCKRITCGEGYELSGNNCVPKACTGYELDDCPPGTDCDICQSGDKFKYKPWGCLLEQGYIERPGSSVRGDCQCVWGEKGCYCDSLRYPYQTIPQNACLQGNCGYAMFNYYQAVCRDGMSYDSAQGACVCERKLSGKVVKVTTAEELYEASKGDADVIMVMNNIKTFTYNSLQFSNKMLVGPDYEKCVLNKNNPLIRMTTPESNDGTNACMVLDNSTVSQLNLECASYLYGQFKIGFITKGNNVIENASVRFTVAERIGGSSLTSMFANDKGTLVLNGDVQLSVGFRDIVNARNYVTLFEDREKALGLTPSAFGQVVSGSPCSTLSIDLTNVPPSESYVMGLGSMSLVGMQNLHYSGNYVVTSEAITFFSHMNPAEQEIILDGGGAIIADTENSAVNLQNMVLDKDVLIRAPSVTMYGTVVNGKVDVVSSSANISNITFGENGFVNNNQSVSVISNQCLALEAVSMNSEAIQKAPSGSREVQNGCYKDFCIGYLATDNAVPEDICDLGNENVSDCAGPDGKYFTCMYKY